MEFLAFSYSISNILRIVSSLAGSYLKNIKHPTKSPMIVRNITKRLTIVVKQFFNILTFKYYKYSFFMFVKVSFIQNDTYFTNTLKKTT